MRLIFLFLLWGFMQVSANSYSQNTMFNLELKNVKIKEALQSIESQSKFRFAYSSEFVDLDQRVNISIRNETINETLQRLFDGTRIRFDIQDRLIMLYTDDESTMVQQNRKVEGNVTDMSRVPLPGVSVVIKGTTLGTITDGNGNFTLTNVPADAILVFSFVGMKTQELSVTGKTTMNIVMQEESIGIEEVVAIGYGTMKKKDLTGSVSSVRTSNFESERPKDLQQLLRGNVAGLNIGMATSAKGGGSLEIRGQRTLKAGASPLIVLDGVIYRGDLSDINPIDIESVDVLKDASSAAVFGAQSANGVVIINTRQGNAAKPTIGVDVSLGVATLFRSEDVYGPYEFLDWRGDIMRSSHRNAPEYMYVDPRTLPSDISVTQWLAYDSSQGDPVDVWLRRLNLSDVEINNYKAGKSTDWKKMVFRSGKEQNYNISLSGKTESLSYYWSIGYTDNEGVVVNDDYSSYRSRLRFEAKVTDFLSVGLNTLFSIRDESGTPVGWASYDNISPWGQPTNEDGTYKIYPTNDGVAAYHPLIDSYYTDRKYTYKSLDNVLFAKIKLPFDISYELNYSPRFTNNELYNHGSSKHPTWALSGGTASRNTASTFSWQVDNLLKWRKTINDIHQIDVTLLANAEKSQAWSQNMSNTQFVPSDVLGYHYIGSGTVPVISSNDTYNTGDAYMARLFYSYKSKYLLTGTVRRDGYSAFGVKNPRATFPSLALAWVFTEEPALKMTWLDYGKLRVSWGANGNRSIGAYDALSSMTNAMISLVNRTTGLVYQESFLNATRMGNNLLKWEKSTSFNVGLDLTFLKNALSSSIDVYDIKTNDLLIDRSLPSVTGYTSVASNLGEISNKGFEITINSRNINKDNLVWRTSFNFSLNRNKIVSLYGNIIDVLDDSGNIIGQKEADDITNKWFIGHAIDEIWDYNVLGVWQTGEEEEAQKYKLAPGDFRLKDVNNSYTFTNDDKEFIGYKKPRFRWTLRNEFTILKNLDFSFSIYSYWGYKTVFNEAKHNPTMDMSRFNSFKLPYWTEKNPRNDFARLNSNMAGVSYDVWWDRSFIRLDNISLSYNFPKRLLHNFKIEQFKMYLTARNVAVWTKEFSFWDPEYAGPTPSYVTLGINMSL
ncbi:MAG: SusC/RagA family TonB-linked outer membrane protein [Mangrovibacterium sp.]